MDRSPFPISEERAEELTAESVSAIKRTDCHMYNECLDQALDANWPNFSCEYCKAYQAISFEQQESDVEALLTVHIAAERIDSTGCAGRKRGVKGGADSKPRCRLPIIKERAEKELPLPLVLP